MFKPVELLLAWRYTRAKRRSYFVSFISAVAVAGIAIGIAALITILSIMNGFEIELRERLLGMSAHLTVTAAPSKMSNWQILNKAINGLPRVIASSAYIEREAMLTNYNNVEGANIQGIDPIKHFNAPRLHESMVVGGLERLNDVRFSIVLGEAIASSLQVQLGDTVTVVSAQPIRTPVGMVPRLRRLEVVGIFAAGVHEYDTAVGFVHIDTAAKLFRYGDAVSGLKIVAREAFAAPELKGIVKSRFAQDSNQTLTVTDWTDDNANLFRALKTEKIVMFVVLALTVAVAAFNLISTLVMLVAEKRGEIAILQTLGLTRRRIVAAFFLHGGLIGVVGIAVGTITGVLLALNVSDVIAWVEALFNFKFLSPEVYYISDIPSQLNIQDVAIAVGVAFVMCLVAPLYPAYAASQIAPAKALRYD